MRQSNKLSAAFIRSVDLTKPKLHADGGNLYLQVSKYGTLSWLFRYMRDGVPRSMGLGPLGTISLAEARERARKHRQALLDGVSPLDVRRKARADAKAEAAKAMTFKAAADAYIAAHSAEWKSRKHVNQWVVTFAGTTKAINDLSVAEIDTPHVLAVLRPLWHKTPETASRIRARIEAVLGWATAAGARQGDNPARWRGHLENLLARPTKLKTVKHHAAIPYKEMPAFMAELRDKPGMSARCLEFAILTAVRTGEAIGAMWHEIDLEARLWVISADRTKAGREHRVPLSERAVAILQALPREGEFVFVGMKAGQPLSQRAMLALVESMRSDATVHGFRSAFRDFCGDETNFPREIAEAALAHSIGNKAEQAYRRGDALGKRRKLMAAWAAYCERPPATGDNVVAIGAAARAS